MSRRYRNMGYKSAHERSSLGEVHVDKAIDTITALCKLHIGTMHTYDKTTAQTVDMLFEPTTIERSRTAHGVVISSHPRVNYKLGDRVHLSVGYENIKLLPIRQDALKFQPHLYGPLEQYIKDVWASHVKFEEVKAVLKWLNRNATAAAIRYYFPTAMKLTGESPAWRELSEVPTRFNEPANIRCWTQAIKDAANTMAAAEMLPKDVPIPDAEDMWLTLGETVVNPDPLSTDVKYTTTQQVYYI